MAKIFYLTGNYLLVKRIFLFTLISGCAAFAHTQSVRVPVSVIYPSIHTYSTQFNDAFSFRSNTAALAGTKNFSAGVFSERRFMLKELTNYSFAVSLPTATGNFGLRGDYYGGPACNETTFNLGYGRKVGNRVDVGVQFHYFTMTASGYGAASAVTFDAGAIFHLTEAVQAGLHVYNPVGAQIGKSGAEKLPAMYSIGIGYDVSTQFFAGAEVQKNRSPATIG